MEPSELMNEAIRVCREGISRGQSPFGCAIAIDGHLVARTHNTVVLSTDITAHAEVNAVREACLARKDIFLSGAMVATTCEPCPMCMSALHWARVETVYFGASIGDADRAGFNELDLSAAELLRVGGSDVKLQGGLLATECRQLFTEWEANTNRRAY